MFVQKDIEETSKKNLYDFLSTFLFMENKKEDKFYKVFLYIYFKIKKRFCKRYKSIKLAKFYFTLISIEYTYINPTHILNVVNFYSYLKKKLSIISIMNYANVNELILMFVNSYSFRFLLNNGYEIRYPITRYVGSSYLATYAYYLVKFEECNSTGLFDFLKYKEGFKQLYFRFKILINQFITNSKAYHRRMKTMEYLDYLEKVSEIMFCFMHDDLRETHFNIGQNIKKDPLWRETFYNHNQKTKELLLTMYYARTILKRTISKYLNTDGKKFKLFQDYDTPFWKLLTNYMNWSDISNFETRRYIQSQSSLIENFTNKQNFQIFNGLGDSSKLLKEDFYKFSKSVDKNILCFENITLMEDVYKFEKEYIQEFEKQSHLVDSFVFSTRYNPWARNRNNINTIKYVDAEEVSKDQDEFDGIPAVELRSLPKDFWERLKFQ